MDNTTNIRRIMGFDYGLRRIGVAVGQMFTKTASPVTTLLADKGMPHWAEILALIKEWRPDALVVGIPCNMDDSDGSVTPYAKAFYKTLSEQVALPIFPVDERLTTKEARLQLKEQLQKKADSRKVDALAACLIVETFMNTQADIS